VGDTAVQQCNGRCSGVVDAKGHAMWIRQDIAECHGMVVEVLAARGCCGKAGRRGDRPQNHSGRWRGR